MLAVYENLNLVLRITIRGRRWFLGFLAGGNFHGEYIAMAADNLAIAVSELSAMSERRVALINDNQFSNLPMFLVNDGGINSGFMIVHVTAAALASENKNLAHPASRPL